LRLFSKLQTLVFLTLIGMIFVRLVWMNLRVYTVRFDPGVLEAIALLEEDAMPCAVDNELLMRTPSGGLVSLPAGLSTWQSSWIYGLYAKLSCSKGSFSPERYIKHNQVLLVIMVTFCILISRLFCRSWLFCLIVAAVLLSRGRLLSEIENISGLGLTTTVFTIWAFTMFHWIKTASLYMYVISWLVLLALIELESSLAILLLGVPSILLLIYHFRKKIIWPVMRRMNSDWKMLRNTFTFTRKRAMELELSEDADLEVHAARHKPLRSQSDVESLDNMFRPLKFPFTLWILTVGRLLNYLKLHLLLSVMVIFLLLVGRHWLGTINFDWVFDVSAWLNIGLANLDLDLSIAVFIITLGLLMKPPGGLLNYWESLWFFVIIAILTTFAAFIWDFSFVGGLNYHAFKISSLAFWLEPVTLCMALLGIYNFLYTINKKLFG